MAFRHVPRAASAELRQWAQTWRAAGEALARVKRAELMQLDTREAVSQLADAFNDAVHTARRTYTSGVVEQQRWFARLRP
jgi:hypothetical protein